MFDKEDLKESFSENMQAAFSPATALVCFVATLIAVIGGPFGTFEAMDISQRTLFWGIVICVSAFVGYSVRAITLCLVGQDRPLLFDLVAVFVMTLIFAPTVWLISQGFNRANGVEAPPIDKMYLYVFVITLGVFVIRRLIPGIEPRTYTFIKSEEGGMPNFDFESEPRLLRRLSPDLRGEVLRLSGQDHHVEIATRQGCETLRLRLSDAIAEMEPVEGFSTHRSHWVARSAISGAERENAHKIWIVLDNGDRVPVSRSYRPELEEAGII